MVSVANARGNFKIIAAVIFTFLKDNVRHATQYTFIYLILQKRETWAKAQSAETESIDKLFKFGQCELMHMDPLLGDISNNEGKLAVLERQNLNIINVIYSEFTKKLYHYINIRMA